MTRSRHTTFCTGISVSYRNRYVVVASFSDLLPWHPFHFRHNDKCFIKCSYQHFHKYCIKLANVIYIMITISRMFKLLFASIAKWDVGFTGMVICCFRPHLKLPKMCSLLLTHLLPCLTTFNIVGYINERELNNWCGVSSICNLFHIELHLTCSVVCGLFHAMPL